MDTRPALHDLAPDQPRAVGLDEAGREVGDRAVPLLDAAGQRFGGGRVGRRGGRARARVPVSARAVRSSTTGSMITRASWCPPAWRWPPCSCWPPVLRFTALGWGLRHTPDLDEQFFVENVRGMLARGDLDHRFHEYPGLVFYLLLPVVAAVDRTTLAREGYLLARGAGGRLRRGQRRPRLPARADAGGPRRRARRRAAARGLADRGADRAHGAARRGAGDVRAARVPRVRARGGGPALGPAVGRGDRRRHGGEVHGRPRSCRRTSCGGCSRRAAPARGLLLAGGRVAGRCSPSARRTRSSTSRPSSAGARSQVGYHYVVRPRGEQSYWGMAADLRPACWPRAWVSPGWRSVGAGAVRRAARLAALAAAAPCSRCVAVAVFSTAEVNRDRYVLPAMGVLAVFAGAAVAWLAARSPRLAVAVALLAAGGRRWCSRSATWPRSRARARATRPWTGCSSTCPRARGS